MYNNNNNTYNNNKNNDHNYNINAIRDKYVNKDLDKSYSIVVCSVMSQCLVYCAMSIQGSGVFYDVSTVSDV